MEDLKLYQSSNEFNEIISEENLILENLIKKKFVIMIGVVKRHYTSHIDHNALICNYVNHLIENYDPGAIKVMCNRNPLWIIKNFKHYISQV